MDYKRFTFMHLLMDMFPVLFAIGRIPGWLAQWTEHVKDAEQKIARPRQIYLGEEERAFVPIERRPKNNNDEQGAGACML